MVSPFFGYGVAAGGTNSSDTDSARKKEFENSLGNLLVAEYQCYRLRERIKNHFSSGDDVLQSSFMFKIDNKWYRINVSAERQPEEKKEEVEEEKQEKQATTGFALPEHVAAAMIDDEEPNEEYTAMP